MRSAQGLSNSVSKRLFGFVTKVNGNSSDGRQHKPVCSVVELVTRDSVVAYAKYLLNDRKLRGESAIQNLVSLYATLKQHPTYKAHDVSWFKDVPSGIQLSAESELRARKEAKSLPYEALVDIAEELHKQRAEAAKMGPRKLAVLVHNELLLRFLLVMVWRQLNIRKCRLGSNLFKDTISPFASMVVPRWVKERIKINPREKFWQYHFREKETKTAHSCPN